MNISSDGTIRQKLGVAKWKKNRGFGIPKSSQLVIFENKSSCMRYQLCKIPQHAEG